MQEPGSLAGILSQSLRRRGPFSLVGPNAAATARPAFASRAACGAALRGGSAALPPHHIAFTPRHWRQTARLHRMRHRPRFRLPYITPFDDDVQHTLATMPLMTTLLRVMPVTDMLVTTVQTMVVMIVPMMETGAGCHAIRLGDPLRGRAFRCNLRFAPISTAIPVASARKLAARSACRRADTPCRSPGHGARQPPRPARADAARRARRGLRLARPGRLRRLRASPRLSAAALRASPVPASPRTGLRTAPGTRARTSADTRADTRADASVVAFGSVLRTAACGSVRTDRHSFAVAAPLRRVPRHRFPLRSYRRFGRPDRPGRPWVSHLTHPRCPPRHGWPCLR